MAESYIYISYNISPEEKEAQNQAKREAVRAAAAERVQTQV